MEHFPCCMLLRLQLPLHCVPTLFSSSSPILLAAPFLPFSSISHPAEMLFHPYSALPTRRTPSDWKSRIRRPMKARRHFKLGPHTINCRCQVVSQSKCEIGTLVSKCHDGRARGMCGCKCEKREEVYVRKEKKTEQKRMGILDCILLFLDLSPVGCLR